MEWRMEYEESNSKSLFKESFYQITPSQTLLQNGLQNLAHDQIVT